MIFPNSVNVSKFKIFIEELRAKNFLDDICIFFDNLSVHRSNAVRERLDELSIPYIFCSPYSPDFNGIEFVFSVFKNKLKRRRIKAICHHQEIDLKKEINKCFYEIDRQIIINCINKSLNNLFNYL